MTDMTERFKRVLDELKAADPADLTAEVLEFLERLEAEVHRPTFEVRTRVESMPDRERLYTKITKDEVVDLFNRWMPNKNSYEFIIRRTKS